MTALVWAWLCAVSVIGTRCLARTDGQIMAGAGLTLAFGWLSIASL